MSINLVEKIAQILKKIEFCLVENCTLEKPPLATKAKGEKLEFDDLQIG